MSRAEDLLLALSADIPVHTHPVVDSDTHYVIDPITRQLSNPDSGKAVIMQFDHYSEQFTFEISRYVDGHDMLQCNSVRVHFINIYSEFEQNPGISYVDDLIVNPDDPSTVICTWLIPRDATQLAGPLNFLVQYACTDANNNMTYEWHTDINTDNTVRAGMDNSEAVTVVYADVLEQWRSSLFGAGDSVLAEIVAAEQSSVATVEEAIAAKAKETLDSIPEDYTATYQLAKEGARTKANAILMETEGEVITIDDSEDAYVRNLRVFGKTTQKVITGKNLFNPGNKERTLYGVTISYDDDGYIHVNGTFTGTTVNQIMVQLGTVELQDESSSSYYYISATVSSNWVKNSSGYAYADGGSNGIIYLRSSGGDYASLSPGTYKCGIFLQPGATYSDCTIRIQLERGQKQTDFEPYTGGMTGPSPEVPVPLDHLSNSTISIYGKNLIINDREADTVEVYKGVTFVTNADKSITVSGTPNAACAWNIVDNVFLPAGTYYLSGAPANTSTKFRLQVNYKPTVDGTEQTGSVDYGGTGAKMTLPYDAYIRAYIYVASDAGAVSGTFYPQLEFGSAATEYEPYKPVQTLIIDRDIPGIPVIIGGNYTDANGQRWICDEVDFERGVYIQRVAQRVLDGATDYTQAGTQFEGTYTAFASYNDVWIDYRNAFMSDKFACYPGTNYSDSSFNEEGVYSNNSTTNNCNLVIFRISNDRGVTDLNSFKAWIAENPVTVLCPLKTPIETSLTAAELTVFEALRTHHTNTTVVNDKGAYMVMEYNGDIKSYLDKLPKATGAEVQAAVDAWLTAHFANAEGVSF